MERPHGRRRNVMTKGAWGGQTPGEIIAITFSRILVNAQVLGGGTIGVAKVPRRALKSAQPIFGGVDKDRVARMNGYIIHVDKVGQGDIGMHAIAR